MQIIFEIIVSLLLIGGGIFGLVGSLGLIVLPTPMARLHAPTMAATLGVGLVLIASLIWFPALGPGFSWHELLITLFLLATAPITGYFIAKAYLWKVQGKSELPSPGPGDEWATFAPEEPPAKIKG